MAGAKGRDKDRSRKVYAEAVGELAALSTAHGVSKFILLSSGGVTIDRYAYYLFWQEKPTLFSRMKLLLTPLCAVTRGRIT